MVFDILLLKFVEIELPVPFKCVVLYIIEFEVGGNSWLLLPLKNEKQKHIYESFLHINIWATNLVPIIVWSIISRDGQ